MGDKGESGVIKGELMQYRPDREVGIRSIASGLL